MASLEEIGRKKRRINRWQASGLHLLISVAIAAGVLVLMLALWYPGPLFEAAGGSGLLFIVVGVDVIVGPLITLVIFKLGKRGLKFDLVTIAVMQLAALAYGLHIVFLARPAFIVFVQDQFQIAAAVDLEPEELAKAKYPQFRQPPIAGPLLAYVDFPSDPDERTALVMAGLGGKDLEQFPRLYAPYEERAAQVLAKAWTIAKVRELEPPAAAVVDDYLKRAGIDESGVRYLRLRARQAWLAVLIDAKSARVLKMLITGKI